MTETAFQMGWIPLPKEQLPMAKGVLPDPNEDNLRERIIFTLHDNGDLPGDMAYGVVGQDRKSKSDEVPTSVEVLARFVYNPKDSAGRCIFPDEIFKALDTPYAAPLAIKLDNLILTAANDLMHAAAEKEQRVVLNITASLFNNPAELRDYCKRIQNTLGEKVAVTLELPEYFDIYRLGTEKFEKSAGVVQDYGFLLAHNNLTLVRGEDEHERITELRRMAPYLDTVNIGVERGSLEDQLRSLMLNDLEELQGAQEVQAYLEDKQFNAVLDVVGRLKVVQEKRKAAELSPAFVDISKGDEQQLAEKLEIILSKSDLLPDEPERMNHEVHNPDTDPPSCYQKPEPVTAEPRDLKKLARALKAAFLCHEDPAYGKSRAEEILASYSQFLTDQEYTKIAEYYDTLKNSVEDIDLDL